MNIRNSADAQSRLIPNHQRIISSRQWVIEDKNNKNHIMTKAEERRSGPGAGTDARRSPKELETAKLQMEYNSVKQENDKLKNVIGKLKQEIDIYTNLLNHNDVPTASSSKGKGKSKTVKSQNSAMVNSLLINTSKRRKKADTPASVTQAAKTQKPKANSATTAAPATTTPSTSATSNQVSDDMVSPDDIMLMNTLTDVLNHMK